MFCAQPHFLDNFFPASLAYMIVERSQEYFQSCAPCTSHYWMLVMSMTYEFTGIGIIKAYFAVALILSDSGREHPSDD